MAKRTLDLALTVPLVALLLPLCLLIALVLSLTGEREVFFRQKRIGKGGEEFWLFKFATMLKDSPNMGTGSVTIAGDPRVLPIGRVLRKAKLNELPQLINVLRGDMTLVGPRPLTPSDFSYYSQEVQEVVQLVKPGLTGLGSIVFRDEEHVLAQSDLPPLEAYEREVAPRKGRLECWYVRNQSLVLDLKILVLTTLVVLFPAVHVAGFFPALIRD